MYMRNYLFYFTLLFILSPAGVLAESSVFKSCELDCVINYEPKSCLACVGSVDVSSASAERCHKDAESFLLSTFAACRNNPWYRKCSWLLSDFSKKLENLCNAQKK